MTEQIRCPVGCGRPRALGKVTCLVCWRRISPSLQNKLTETRRDWMYDPGNIFKQQAYADAINRAVASVPHQPGATKLVAVEDIVDMKPTLPGLS